MGVDSAEVTVSRAVQYHPLHHCTQGQHRGNSTLHTSHGCCAPGNCTVVLLSLHPRPWNKDKNVLGLPRRNEDRSVKSFNRRHYSKTIEKIPVTMTKHKCEGCEYNKSLKFVYHGLHWMEERSGGGWRGEVVFHLYKHSLSLHSFLTLSTIFSKIVNISLDVWHT